MAHLYPSDSVALQKIMIKAIKSSFCAAVDLGAPQETASLAGVPGSPDSSSTYQIFLEAVRLVSISSRFCRHEIAKAGAGTELGKQAGLLVPAWWPRGFTGLLVTAGLGSVVF